MAYTVKQVAAMSGVSVRTLHFYDEAGLLKPANHGANGYRFYEEPQLLALQQILFYRELGFELKQIKEILGRANFEKVAALESHRKRGVGKSLMTAIMAHPELQGLRRWTLATRDAHGLYRQFGFGAPAHPERQMEVLVKEPYHA